MQNNVNDINGGTLQSPTDLLISNSQNSLLTNENQNKPNKILSRTMLLSRPGTQNITSPKNLVNLHLAFSRFINRIKIKKSHIAKDIEIRILDVSYFLTTILRCAGILP